MLRTDPLSPPAAPAAARPRWRWVPGPLGLVVAVAAVAGARLGLKPIGDNSTLVHLRTGIELVRTGHVPTRDPYSFTAAGHPWVVQSWLASLIYGLANGIGHHALVVVQALAMGGVGAITALAARSSSATRTGVAALLAVAAGAPGWSPRPLMFGLLCLALTILVTERDASPWWLVPVVWVWVNTHGSYPLGLAWLAAHGVGEAIDRGGWPRRTFRYLGGFAAGLAVGLANPVGYRLLTFPLVALQKRQTFQGIVEWRSPNFQDTNTFIALVFIAAALVVLLRAPMPWRHLLPVGGFLVLGLVSERNLAPLAVVLAPALGFALAAKPGARHPLDRTGAVEWVRRNTAGLGSRTAFRAAALAAIVLTAAGLTAYGYSQPTLDLSSYPVAATSFLARTGRLGPAHRIAAVDVVGCYLVWRAGPATKVFIDDRYDMYPAAVTADAAVLAGGRADAAAVLDRWRVDTVIWSVNQALPGTLLAAGGWSEVYSDAQWAVLERSAAAV